jgi:hypothetical protein
VRRVSYYHKDTGIIDHVVYVFSDDSALALNRPSADHFPLDHPEDGSVYDHLSQRVDVTTKQVVDYQPPQPSQDHEWNATAKRWTLNQTAQAKLDARAQARAQIDTLIQTQHDIVRKAVLEQDLVRKGLLADSPALEQLRSIHDAIIALRATVQKVDTRDDTSE